MLDGLHARLRNLVRRDTVTIEMEDELRDHLERSTELYIRRGLAPDEARAAAHRELGSASLIAENAREAWGSRAVDDLWRDIRHALRALARTPGFALVVIVTLAFGFGVNGAMLSLVRGAINTSAVPQPETWVHVPDLWSWADYEYFRDSVRAMRELNATSEQPVLVRTSPDRPPEEVRALFVSGNYFTGLGGRPALGRLFGSEELSPPAGEPVLILSHRFWMRHYGGDSSVIGRGIRLGGGQAFTVVGVMPRDFVGINLRVPDFWLPMGTRARLPGNGQSIRRIGDDSWFSASGREFLFIAGRIAPDATLDGVRTELALRIAQRSLPDDSTRGRSVATNLRLASLSPLQGTAEIAIAGLILGAAISVLLIASVTVANLMLARAVARRREMGIRVALGAARSRVVRAWLTECLLLGGSAAGVGLFLSFAAVRALTSARSLWPDDLDLDLELLADKFQPDAAVVLYLAVLAVLATLVFGLTPILRATTGDPLTSIRDTGAAAGARRDRVALRSSLVIGQVAMTMMLLVVSGMFLRGLLHAASVDPGVDRHEVLVVRPSLVLSGYDSTRARLFIDDLGARSTAIAGVQSVARGNVPFLNSALATVTRAGGEPANTRTSGQFNAVSESYFATLGIAIERGRAFTTEEVRREAPVAIISAATARTLFAGEEPLGQLVTIRPTVRGISELSRAGQRPAEGLFESARVVGIAADVQTPRMGVVPRRYAYVPGDYWDLMIRRDPERASEIEARLLALAREIDPDVVLWTRSMEHVIWNSHGFLAIAPMITSIGVVIGTLSLGLAVVGLFGLTAYSVEQRTREFGVRMALGARAGDVVRLVAAQSLKLVVIGVVIGLAGAAAGGGVIRNLLIGVRTVDPLAYAAVALVMIVVSFLACWIPARRATTVDPMIALRTD